MASPISGAVFAGPVLEQAPSYALDKWSGLSGTYFLLFGGVILIITLNPEGVMGAMRAKMHRKDVADRPPRWRSARRRYPSAAEEMAARPVLSAEAVSVKSFFGACTP